MSPWRPRRSQGTKERPWNGRDKARGCWEDPWPTPNRGKVVEAMKKIRRSWDRNKASSKELRQANIRPRKGHGSREKQRRGRKGPDRGRGGPRLPMDVPSTPRKVNMRPDLCRGGLREPKQNPRKTKLGPMWVLTKPWGDRGGLNVKIDWIDMLDLSGNRLGLDKVERNQTKAEQVPRNQGKVREGSHRSWGDAWCSRDALHVL